MIGPFQEQAGLMLRVLPHVAAEACFALKGGTAINFFLRDMPRLSVDIDLTYLPVEARKDTLAGIGGALVRIEARILRAMPGVLIQKGLYEGGVYKLFVRGPAGEVKIEPNLVIRGAVLPPVQRELCPESGRKFRMALSIKTLSDADLYGGKICAALDRQHPRDLFDIKLLLANEGLTDAIRKAFLIYLVSHDRPMHELIDPPRKDFLEVFENEFSGMTEMPVSYEELIAAREYLFSRLQSELTGAERKFILSVKEGSPDWKLLDLPGVEKLPAIQWKLQNIAKMSPAKHREQLRKLKERLGL